MTNAAVFKQYFGIYATELWVKNHDEFIEWINAEYKPEAISSIPLGKEQIDCNLVLNRAVKGLSCCILRDPDDKPRCNECPASKPDYLKSALKYENANCDVQQPKVLTLEEIDKIIFNAKEGHENIFWAEVRSKHRISFGVMQLDFSLDGNYEALLIGCSWPCLYSKETYGVKWRCWTSRPTDEQRRKVSWNG